MLLAATLWPALTKAQECVGDCNSDGRVAVNELVTGVSIALGRADISSCPAFDGGAGTVPISILVTAVGNALNGCGAPTPTVTTAPAPTATATANEIFQGALVPATGRFTYQATVGIDGADAECAAQLSGAHACTIAELRQAAADGELNGAKDTLGADVTSFWAIDPTRPDVDQCQVTVPWDYATAHTGQFGDVVALANASGSLGELQEDTLCVTRHWVACCL